MKNLAHEYALDMGVSVERYREDFDGMCIDFAGDFCDSKLGKRHKARMPYFDNIEDSRWRYHCTIQVDGMIHDLWEDKPMPLVDYMKLIGAETVEYPAEEKEKHGN